ncbi:MAG TPA: SDR family NAD(P)-dependent oxidoreductase [Bryobacteraceae bacterium]|nr:SDR family NAD(P)-dependent oxidoreductase [Bryobacteraceae bacterium]
MRTFKDKCVLVTGAGRGIGKRLAIGFARAGARVGLLARSRAELDLTHMEIEHAGGAALRIRADVTDYDQVCAAVDRMRVHFGGVHVLVAAAAIQGPIGPLAECAPKAWVEAIETNLIGVMHACRAVLPQMIERRSGKIIVLSDEGCAAPRRNFSAYASAKAGVARLVETLAEEVRDHNIQVNCMAPGATYTHMTDQILSAGDRAGWKAKEEALELRFSGGTPAEKQIELALFLASERSNHISGRLIHVNDDWQRLEHSSIHPELYTLRRVRTGTF